MSDRRQVVITANIFPGLEIERETLAPLGVDLVKRPCANEAEVVAAGKEAAALIVGNAPITAQVLGQLPRCLAIVKPAVGVDNIDIDAATDAGICVANVPDYGTDEVAAHAMALILNALRHVDACAADVRAGRWQPKPPYPIQRSLGRTLGIVGFGRIGRSVARKAGGFGWRLLACDPYVDASEMRRRGVEAVDFDTLLAQSDFVTLHLPLTAETRDLIDAGALAKMKPTAFLVNTARGKICDRDAVVRALESGQLAGYAGDVWVPQPAPNDHPWRTMPNHALTPHTSGTSLSAQARYAAGVREILECWFEGKPIREEYLIVQGGALAGAGAHSYSEGDATGGSEEAARFSSNS